MRCDECGRPMKNAEMWQLGGDPRAPTSRSMKQLCWDCRQKLEDPTKPAEQEDSASVLTEASDIVRRSDADHV